MTVTDLIEGWRAGLEHERRHISEAGLDAPVTASEARLVQTVGGLHLYEFLLPLGVSLSIVLWARCRRIAMCC